jgi:hypothetical protein
VFINKKDFNIVYLLLSIIVLSIFVLSDTILQQEKLDDVDLAKVEDIIRTNGNSFREIHEDYSKTRTGDSETICRKIEDIKEYCFNYTGLKLKCNKNFYELPNLNISRCNEITDFECRNESTFSEECSVKIFSSQIFIEDSLGSNVYKEFAEVVDFKSENDSLVINWWNRTVILKPYIKSSLEKISISEIVKTPELISKKEAQILEEGKEKPVIDSLDFKSEIVNKTDSYYFNHTMNSDSYNIDYFGYEIESTNVDCNFEDNSLICDNVRVDFTEAVEKQELILTSEKVSDTLQIEMTGASLAYIDPYIYLGTTGTHVPEDTYVNQSAPTTNYESKTYLAIGQYGPNNSTESFVKFNISSLPTTNIRVSAAEFNPYFLTAIYQGNPQLNITFYKGLNTTWKEENTTWNNKINYNLSLYSNSSIVNSSTVNYSNFWYDVTSIVSDAYEKSEKNVTFVGLGNVSNITTDLIIATFGSKENTNSTRRPYLQVWYMYLSDYNITTCQTLNSPNLTVTLLSDITDYAAAAICMDITADYVTFNCNSKNIDGLDFIGALIGIGVSNVKNFTLKNCKVTDFGAGVWVQDYSYGLIKNSSFKSGESSLINSGLYGSGNLTIIDSNFSLNDYGIYFSTGSTNITNSSIMNNNDEDVYSFTGTGVSNSNFNNVIGTGNKQIILLKDSVNISGWNNNFSQLLIGNAVNSLINNITQYSTVINNRLNIIGGENITITNCTFNNVSISLGNSTNLSVFNNLFNTSNLDIVDVIYNFNTSKKVGTRKYSSGINIGGNYYTNYLRTGTSDTCTDNDYDGFCDSAYSLGYSNYDYLPLSDEYDLIPPTYNGTGTISGIKYGQNVIFSMNVYDNLSNLSNYTFSWNGSGIYYQENVTSYYYEDTYTDPMKLLDNNWSTYATRTTTVNSKYFYLNYSYVNNSFDAIWQIRDYCGTTNNSINSCFNKNVLQLRLNGYFSTVLSWECYNGSSWNTMTACALTRGYEEGIYWNKTGIWTNDTSTSLSGTSSSLSRTKTSYAKRNETICGKFYIYDKNGNLNETSNICYTPENTAPTFDNTNVQYSVAHNYNVSLKINATDVDEDTLTYGINNTGFTINSTTGWINKSNSLSNTGVYYVKVNVTDTFNNSYNETTIIINITNSAPSISSAQLTPIAAVDDDNLTCNPGATSDPESDTVTLIYDWIKNGTLMGINSRNLTSGNTSFYDVWQCKIIPTDGVDNGSAIYSNQINVGTGWAAPSINNSNATTSLTGIISTSTSPTNNNSWVNLTTRLWDYNSGDLWKVYFCKTNEFTISGCTGGEYCSISTFSNQVNQSCRYDLIPATETSYTFYSFVIDNTSMISGSVSNTFYVNYPPSSSAIVSPTSNTVYNYSNVEFIATDVNGDLINYTMYGANTTGIYKQLYSGNLSQYVWENLSQGTHHLKAMTTDKYGYSLLVNSSEYAFTVDWTAPNVTGFSVSTSIPDVTSNVRFYVNLNDTYTSVQSDACIISLQKGDYNSGLEFNLTPTSGKVGDQVSILQTMYSYGVGTLNWTKTYCEDELGNLVMNSTGGILLTISVDLGGTTVTGGSNLLVREALLSTNLTGFCGDQVCQSSENPANCWQDCKVNYDTLVTCIWDKEKECNWSQNWFPMTILLILAVTGIISIYVYQIRNRKV